MSGWLRSLKLCGVRQEMRHGVAGWRKWRMLRAAVMVPPGNGLLAMLGVDYRVCGRDWAAYEAETFRRAHPEQGLPVVLPDGAVWLPDLPGVVVRECLSEASIDAAFAELGRFHRLGMAHGDPHTGNFILGPAEGRCRIIDFETRVDRMSKRAWGWDFLVLAMDAAKRGAAGPDWDRWGEAYGDPEIGGIAVALLNRAPAGLRAMLFLMGYK